MANHLGDIYARHAGLEIHTDQAVAVVGVGGIGFWVALYLAMAGVRRLDLYDSDTVSISNLNRLPVPPAAVGRMKVEAAEEEVRRLRADTVINLATNYNPKLHSLNYMDWVVCSTDTQKSRKMMQAEAKKSRCRYLELGADGVRCHVTGETAEWSTAEEERPGYQSVPIFVGPCTLAASLAVYYVLHGRVPAMTTGFNFLNNEIKVVQRRD